MRKPLNDLSATFVRNILDYDPVTGIMTWKARVVRTDTTGHKAGDTSFNNRFAGKVVTGRVSKTGHVGVAIHNKRYLFHRLAWLHCYGEWPNQGLDHINTNPADNRIENLRLSNQQGNTANARLRRDNTSGYRGVFYVPATGKWRAIIVVDRKARNLGTYFTRTAAFAAYMAASRMYFGEFSPKAAHVSVQEGVGD